MGVSPSGVGHQKALVIAHGLRERRRSVLHIARTYGGGGGVVHIVACLTIGAWTGYMCTRYLMGRGRGGGGGGCSCFGMPYHRRTYNIDVYYHRYLIVIGACTVYIL